jgi:hypothetical protein
LLRSFYYRSDSRTAAGKLLPISWVVFYSGSFSHCPLADFALNAKRELCSRLVLHRNKSENRHLAAIEDNAIDVSTRNVRLVPKSLHTSNLACAIRAKAQYGCFYSAVFVRL